MDISQLNAEAVEALKDDDVITSAIAEYSQKFPQVSESQRMPCRGTWNKSFVQMHLSRAHVHESYFKM